MTTPRLLIATLVVSSALYACSRPAAKSETPPAPSAAPAGTAPALPAAVPSHGDEAVATATGTVAETMDAANYTYVRVTTPTGDIWAATSQFKVAVGDRVTVPLEMPMENFHSQALKRDFPLIYFASGIAREGEQAQPAMPPGHPPTGGAAPNPAGTVTERIEPAPGGTTVADVWAKRSSLDGKTVTVRGKVVKFNPEIMGRNWIHIQDGTGKPAEKNHDLTVTTSSGVKVGDIVTVTGKIAVDKDFGAGYAYPVIVEEAVVVLK